MLYYTILYYTILYYTIIYYTMLCYTMLYYTILYYTILCYTILYYTILYYQDRDNGEVEYLRKLRLLSDGRGEYLADQIDEGRYFWVGKLSDHSGMVHILSYHDHLETITKTTRHIFSILLCSH